MGIEGIADFLGVSVAVIIWTPIVIIGIKVIYWVCLYMNIGHVIDNQRTIVEQVEKALKNQSATDENEKIRNERLINELKKQNELLRDELKKQNEESKRQTDLLEKILINKK